MTRILLSSLLCALTGACGAQNRSGDTVPPMELFETTFELRVELPEAEPPAEDDSMCAVPIREPAPSVSGQPAVGLRAILVRGALFRSAVTDADGVGHVSAEESGSHLVELQTEDGASLGVLDLDVELPMTVLVGEWRPDRDDTDEDGDREEWAVFVDMVTDGDQDGFSDNGRRAHWMFGSEGGVVFRHAHRRSERVELTGDYIESAVQAFGDLDGDFIPDSEDLDKNGNEITDNQETSLSCPGFTHDDFFVPGSAHEKMDCGTCHVGSAAPLACDDCHTPSGRAWTESPVSPAGHFARNCEQCHLASAPWDAVPGASGESHLSFPLTGAHLETTCFTCHVGGRVEDLATNCADCHAAPSGHPDMACTNCHTTESWSDVTVHAGPVPTSPFDYAAWSGRWFPIPPSGHADADRCDDCHVRMDEGDYAYFTCTSCHSDAAALDAWHNHGQDRGSNASHRFSLYFFDPDDSSAPPTWPTAHTGCVNAACHATGVLP